jgi:uncharacterized membrane protein YjjP (DUF1212 family)
MVDWSTFVRTPGVAMAAADEFSSGPFFSLSPEVAMELRQQSFQWQRRSPDWLVAIVSGFAAGAVLMVLDLLWSSLVTGGPWRTSHMIAPIFLGTDVVQSSNHPFSLSVVAVALAAHYVLGIVFGVILAAVMTPFNLDSTAAKALVTGAAFGLVLYFVNFYGMVRFLPWLVDLRGWATVAAHLVFGSVAALLYWKLERTTKEA